MYPVKLNICFGVTDCLYVAHLYRFEMKAHTLHCFIATQHYIATDGPHTPVCSLPQYPHLSSHLSTLQPDGRLQFAFLSPGQMMCHTVTLCFSAHVGNNLAVVIIITFV
jgi:hypothetical protein